MSSAASAAAALVSMPARTLFSPPIVSQFAPRAFQVGHCDFDLLQLARQGVRGSCGRLGHENINRSPGSKLQELGAQASRSCRDRKTSADAASAEGSPSGPWQRASWQHRELGSHGLDCGVGLLPVFLLLFRCDCKRSRFFWSLIARRNHPEFFECLLKAIAR